MKRLLTVLCLLLSTALFAQKGLTDSARRVLDSLPESDIDIPITINLRPLYALAEKRVDTAFASPDWPAGWVQPDCGTRYKYHLRRSPLRFSATGTSFNLAFTGFYRIIGSSRACVRGTVVSPWTPECSCGVSESERRVVIGFGASFTLLPDMRLITTIVHPEPQALDKCTVCFWGQDVTKTVIDGVRAKLDASKKEMQDSFGVWPSALTCNRHGISSARFMQSLVQAISPFTPNASAWKTYRLRTTCSTSRSAFPPPRW
jgi:hypothetical protein